MIIVGRLKLGVRLSGAKVELGHSTGTYALLYAAAIKGVRCGYVLQRQNRPLPTYESLSDFMDDTDRKCHL
jgi:hypothetical protein